MPRIFISYRREDSIAYAGRIYDRLISRFGASNVFMDIDTLEPGVDFIDELERTVQSCDVFLAVLGTRWLTVKDEGGRSRLSNPEDFVALEISAALKKTNIRIVPILVGGASMPRSSELPDGLSGFARRNALVLPDIGFQQTLGRLIHSVERAEQEQLEREKVEAEQTTREELRKQAAEQARLEEKRKEAAERARLEKERKQRAELARQEEEFERSAKRPVLKEERKRAKSAGADHGEQQDVLVVISHVKWAIITLISLGLVAGVFLYFKSRHGTQKPPLSDTQEPSYSGTQEPSTVGNAPPPAIASIVERPSQVQQRTHSPRDPFVGSWTGEQLVPLSDQSRLRAKWRLYVKTLHPELKAFGPERDFPAAMRKAGMFSVLLEYDSTRLDYDHKITSQTPLEGAQESQQCSFTYSGDSTGISDTGSNQKLNLSLKLTSSSHCEEPPPQRLAATQVDYSHATDRSDLGSGLILGNDKSFNNVDRWEDVTIYFESSETPN
jgi:hypothetical protein